MSRYSLRLLLVAMLLQHASAWEKDISIKTKKFFKKILVPLQQPIVAEYKDLTVLDKFANYSMAKVENATGDIVIWNKRATANLVVLPCDDCWVDTADEVATSNLSMGEDELEKVTASLAETEAAELAAKQSLPPHARYVNKLLIYLNKEMKSVWQFYSLIDRKRWGVGNTITSMPYGPHGEHPDKWQRNITVMKPTIEPPLGFSNLSQKVSMIKAVKHTFKNKYAIQLQQDYESLIKNIKDQHKKAGMLKASLLKMDGHADEFIELPSGVWNKIDVSERRLGLRTREAEKVDVHV